MQNSPREHSATLSTIKLQFAIKTFLSGRLKGTAIQIISTFYQKELYEP